MTDYAQINPGKHHLGYRFPTPVLIEKLPMHAEDEYSIELKYKHVVTVNRTAYVGNVQAFSRRKGSIKVEGDAMYKSVVNEFDTFASYNKIEAAVNDGEEITGLAEFADKILQFKQNTLYVINVSRQVEVLESTHKHKGVSNPAAICKTDYGIAWANQHGCYLYDGRKVVDLLEKGGIQRIKEDTWSDFIDTPMVGYFPQKRQIIVVDDISTTGDGACYIYDMVTASWTNATSATFADAVKSNFITDWNGDLVHATSATPKKWSDTSASTNSFNFKTKDIDFGHPSLRKKVYRVRISYKGDANSLRVEYTINGDTDTFLKFEDTDDTTGKPTGSETFQPLANQTDLTVWHHVELKPATSSEANNIYSFQLRILGQTGAGTAPEITRVECVADVSDSLDGKYFDITTGGGKTLIWFDTDDSGTSAPSGTGSYADTIEVTQVGTGDSAERVAIALASAINEDAGAHTTAEVDGSAVIITDVQNQARTNASDGDTGFTIITASEGGTGSAPATFEINDISIIYRIKSVK